MAYVHLGGSDNPVGFCWLHKRTLSTRQLKRKKCLEKECRHLQKYEDHMFWKQRERKKALAKKHRKEKKDGLR